MWNSLEQYWQEAFTLAWDAFCRDTVPIGCVIANAEGEIIARGQNAIWDPTSAFPLAGTSLAHAEIAALSHLQRIEHPDIRSYTLYSTLEPCPMCFGAIVMANIRQIKYAGRDRIAGSTALQSASEYIARKQLKTERAEPLLEVFQTVLSTAFEWKRNYTRRDILLEAWENDCPAGVDIGTELFKQGYFTRAVEEGYHAKQVFQDVMRKWNGE